MRTILFKKGGGELYSLKLSMSKRQRKAEETFQIKGDKKLNVMPSPRLEPILEGEKCYKEHYLVN